MFECKCVIDSSGSDDCESGDTSFKFSLKRQRISMSLPT